MIYIITYLLNLFDLAITSYWVNRYGTEIEGNPIGKILYETKAVYPVKILVVGALLALLWWLTELEPSYKWVGYVPLVAYTGLTVYHIIVAVKVWTVTKL